MLDLNCKVCMETIEIAAAGATSAQEIVGFLLDCAASGRRDVMGGQPGKSPVATDLRP